jgi:hypothetical protein
MKSIARQLELLNGLRTKAGNDQRVGVQVTRTRFTIRRIGLALLLLSAIAEVADATAQAPLVALAETKGQVDPGLVQLQREKLELEIGKLREENKSIQQKLPWEIEGLRIANQNSRRTIGGFAFLNGTVIAAIVAAFITLITFFIDRRQAREKEDEQRFEETVKAMGSEHSQAQVGGVVILSNFLEKGYERFRVQVFNLAAAYLRKTTALDFPPRVLTAKRNKDNSSAREYRSPFLTSEVKQALKIVFMKSYPLARAKLSTDVKGNPDIRSYLNAEGVDLSGIYWARADLKYAWLRGATLSRSELPAADMSYANLANCDLSASKLDRAQFTRTDLSRCNFVNANLEYAQFTDTSLVDADLRDAKLKGVSFTNCSLAGIKFNPQDWSQVKIDSESSVRLLQSGDQ